MKSWSRTGIASIWFLLMETRMFKAPEDPGHRARWRKPRGNFSPRSLASLVQETVVA